MTKIYSHRFRCDLCQVSVGEGQVYPMAEGDPYEHICHNCILSGWITFCSKCWHSCSPDDLDINFICKKCREKEG